MTGPTWTILIPTIPQREALFLRLLRVLLPQLDAYDGAVSVLAWRNAGERTIGEIRDGLVGAATTDYISFIDDDDLVPEFYVAEVVTALAARPDHVGYQLEYCVNGVAEEIVDHSLRHGKWHRNAEDTLVRDFTHVDPILRDKAMRGRFAQARRGRAEDRVWVKQVRPYLHTEVYIDKIMYHYLWSHSTSSWQKPEQVLKLDTPRPAVAHPYFTWHPASL